MRAPGIWLRVEVDAADHPKVGRLARLLGVPKSEAFALVFRLWGHAALYSPRGCFATPEDAADAARFHGSPELFGEALLSAGYCDPDPGRGVDVGDDALVLHDWEEHNGKLGDFREAEAERLRNWRDRKRRQKSGGALESAARTGQPVGVESAARTRPNPESAARTGSPADLPGEGRKPRTRTPYVRRTAPVRDEVRNADDTPYETGTVRVSYVVDVDVDGKTTLPERKALSFATPVAVAREGVLSEEPEGEDDSRLQGCLDLLRQHYPRFGDEPRVARALFTVRAELPSLEAFGEALAAHVASGAWQENRGAYVPRCDRWLLGFGWRDKPQEARGSRTGRQSSGSGVAVGKPVDAATASALSRLSAGGGRR